MPVDTRTSLGPLVFTRASRARREPARSASFAAPATANARGSRAISGATAIQHPAGHPMTTFLVTSNSTGITRCSRLRGSACPRPIGTSETPFMARHTAVRFSDHGCDAAHQLKEQSQRPTRDTGDAPHPSPLPASGERERDPWRIQDAPPDRRTHACAERSGRVRGGRRPIWADLARKTA